MKKKAPELLDKLSWGTVVGAGFFVLGKLRTRTGLLVIFYLFIILECK